MLSSETGSIVIAVRKRTILRSQEWMRANVADCLWRNRVLQLAKVRGTGLGSVAPQWHQRWSSAFCVSLPSANLPYIIFEWVLFFEYYCTGYVSETMYMKRWGIWATRNGCVCQRRGHVNPLLRLPNCSGLTSVITGYGRP